MFAFLSDNLAIVTLFGVTLVVLGLLALVVWASIVRESPAAQAKATMPRLQVDTLKQSFRRAVELIEANIAARPERYNVPWALVINGVDPQPDPQTGQAASTHLPLTSSGLSSAMSSDAAMAASALGMEWNFFDAGVVLQLRGEFLGDPDREDDERERTWDALLGLCRAYRPDRPFDSLVLSIPAALLLDTSPSGLTRISAQAKALHRRLWLAQNRFALRFPVYLLVSGAEQIPGFSDFAAGLSQEQRAGMLGWSNPHELAAPFQVAWIHAAMDQIVADTAQSVSELAAVEPVGRDSSAYFLLPSELDRLRDGLRCLTEELMRPSAYHEPFMLRGVYLSGQAQADPTDPGHRPWSVPAFLKDLFDRKVFAEAGLVRASAVQRLRRPALHAALRWTAAAVLVAWGIGLAVATWSLEGTVGQLTVAIQRLDQDTLNSVHSKSLSRLSPNESRARAMSALTLISQVDAGALGSVFMPGSWSWFDALPDRVQQRLELRFSENSFEPIRNALYAQIGDLTGTPVDPTTGELIQGAACTLPAGWQEGLLSTKGGSISVDDAPEFAALLRFVGRVELMDRVVAARIRLVQGREPASAADLRLVVGALLGADITVNPERTAELFRKYSRPISQTQKMQSALNCSLSLAVQELHQRLFDRNELLLLEASIAETVARQLDGASGAWDAQEARSGWVALLADMQRQEELFRPGRGQWMQSDKLQLGPAYESMLQRVEAIKLLGADAAPAIRAAATEAHVRFREEWQNHAASDTGLLGGSLVWNDKEGRWAYSDGRAAFKSALQTLLLMPHMQGLTRRTLPEPSSDRAHAWDSVRLDQAAQLYEVRRKVESEVLSKVPEAVRLELDRLSRLLLAEAIVDGTVQAMSPTPVRVTSPSEPERLALGRIRVQLIDLGAAPSAQKLVSLLAGDALARLRLLEDAWVASEPFLPSERGLQGWSGDRPPMWEAYGVEDANGMSAYVAQQQARVLQLARDAEIILAGMEPAANRAGGLSGADDALVRRWRSIVAEAERFKNKNALSSLVQLDQFLNVTVAELDLNNCGEKLLGRPPGRRATDPLATVHRRLHDELLQRCRTLKVAELRRLWAGFREGFNREAAGRLPFALQPEMPTSPLVASGLVPAPAKAGGSPSNRPPMQTEEVVATLRQFERIHRLLGDKVLESGGRHPAGSSVIRFSQQFEQLRQFLSPLLANQDDGPPAFDIMAELRAFPQDEIEGNKFIEWDLTVGPQTQSFREAAKPLRWAPGMPVDFVLRTARNALIQPVTDLRLPGMTVDDTVVRFSFADPWALLSIAYAYRDQDRRSVDSRAPVLRFEFPVNRRETERGASTLGKARVYVRLSVSPAGKRTALAWPSAVPSLAPEWGSP